MENDKYLITGAGSGFGKSMAFGLAKKGYDVIASVEVLSQVSVLKKEAEEKKIQLTVEKLDVTDPVDRERAGTWDVDVLVNNAGISEGGGVADIPEKNLRNQFEVNVFGPILLTQIIAKQMAKKSHGRIVFISSVSGIMADPLSGPYGSSKFSIEAFADALSKEMQEFHVEVSVINPGPYLTGFNDREFERWKTWQDDPKERLFDYQKAAFPYEQLNPKSPIHGMLDVVTGKTKKYRNVFPSLMMPMVKKRQRELWQRKSDEEIGERHKLVQKSYDIDPETSMKEAVIDRIKDIF